MQEMSKQLQLPDQARVQYQTNPARYQGPNCNEVYVSMELRGCLVCQSTHPKHGSKQCNADDFFFVK